METLPAIKKQQMIELRKDDHLDKRKGLLDVSEVQWGLGANEMILAQSSVEMPIRKYNDEKLIEKIKTMSKFVCRDIGVTYWDQPKQMQYDNTRFFTTIKKYYSDFSISEIKTAFEMASIGELDEWLPKDKNGAADNKHYNSFNLAYYSKILNAYRKKRNQVWSKVRRLLPVAESTISEEEKKENNRFFINEIYDAFDQYQINEIKPNFIMTMYLEEFLHQRLIKEIKKPTKSTIDKVYKNNLTKTRGKERRKLIDEYHSNNFKGSLKNQYQTAQNNLELERIFKEIIKQEKHLRDFLKYRYE